MLAALCYGHTSIDSRERKGGLDPTTCVSLLSTTTKTTPRGVELIIGCWFLKESVFISVCLIYALMKRSMQSLLRRADVGNAAEVQTSCGRLRFICIPTGRVGTREGRERQNGERREEREGERGHPLLNWTRPRDLNAHSIRVVDTSSHKSHTFVCVCISSQIQRVEKIIPKVPRMSIYWLGSISCKWCCSDANRHRLHATLSLKDDPEREEALVSRASLKARLVARRRHEPSANAHV